MQSHSIRLAAVSEELRSQNLEPAINIEITPLWLHNQPEAGVAPWSPYKRRRCVDLSMDTMHLKDPLVLFGSEGSAFTVPLFLLSLRIIMFCHIYSTMSKHHFLVMFYGTKWPLCADVPLNPHASIHFMFNHSHNLYEPMCYLR